MTAPSTVPMRTSGTESVIKALRTKTRVSPVAWVNGQRGCSHLQTDRPDDGAGDALEDSSNNHNGWREADVSVLLESVAGVSTTERSTDQRSSPP